jgi:PAS domain S-box-containing protein
MKIAPLPEDEQERIAELRKYNILDTEPEAVFENMVQLATYICQTPIAAISLIDDDRQWFKAIKGIDAKQTPRDVAFCAHAILQDDPFVIPNALEDERFFDNPLVTGGPEIRFYAGVPLVTSSGRHLGTLCVIDTVARELEPEQIEAVKTLADSVMAHLDLGLSHRQIRKYVDELQLSGTIFESASEAIVVTDPDNKIITVNPAFTATTGYALDEVVGKNPKLLNSGRQSREFFEKMWNALDNNGHWDGELWNRRKNGEEYIEWLSVDVIFNDDGSKRLYLAIFSDVTEKENTKIRLQQLLMRQEEILEERMKLQENLESINEHLNEMVKEETEKRLENEKLLIQQSKMAVMGEMIGAIAHQWRQPLNSLGMAIQDVEMAHRYGELNDEYLSNFKQEAMRTIQTMSSTIDDFRNFFSNNKKQEEFYIEDAINDILKMLSAQFKIGGIAIVFDNEGSGRHKYLCYKNELKQVILNILANAKDALVEQKKEGAFIKIAIAQNDDALTISCEDSAGGIPEEIISKVFDSHFTTKTEDKGTGIGLYMSKEIVENSLNGKLYVKNTQNGAMFVIELPMKNLSENQAL